MGKKHFEVLMSTYNGENFLEEQLQSIFSQKDVDVTLLVRDDGSTDKTVGILNDYQRQGLLKWYTGENLKPARSFLHLLATAGNADYYAFSDQDDYWMPDKLKVAVDMLSAYSDVPALYFCQTQLADADLNKIPSVIINPYITLGEALVYQFIGGCTMVMNSKLRDIVLRYNPSCLPMHDVWIYNVALAVGAKVVFDSTPHMLYRQHGGNVIGQKVHNADEWRKRLRAFWAGKRNTRSSLAQELYNGYYKLMPIENTIIVREYLEGKKSFFRRCKMLFDSRYKCSNRKTYYLFKLAVLLNAY